MFLWGRVPIFCWLSVSLGSRSYILLVECFSGVAFLYFVFFVTTVIFLAHCLHYSSSHVPYVILIATIIIL